MVVKTKLLQHESDHLKIFTWLKAMQINRPRVSYKWPKLVQSVLETK